MNGTENPSRADRGATAPWHSVEHDTFGNAIREIRARRGLSQEVLGFRSGLHRNYIGAMERGEINPTFKVLMKLSEGLAMPLSEIVALFEKRLSSDEPPPRRRRRRRRRS